MVQHNSSEELSGQVKDKLEMLNKIKLFEPCIREDLLEITRLCKFHEMEEGEFIIEKGEIPGGLFMLESGQVSVRLTPDSKPLTKIGPGGYVGEMALLDNQPRSAYVYCDSPGRLLFLPIDGLLELLQSHSETASKILFILARVLTRRLRSTNERVEELEQRLQELEDQSSE